MPDAEASPEKAEENSSDSADEIAVGLSRAWHRNSAGA